MTIDSNPAANTPYPGPDLSGLYLQGTMICPRGHGYAVEYVVRLVGPERRMEVRGLEPGKCRRCGL